MKLHPGVGLIAQRIGDPHADALHAPAAALDVVAIEDDHVAAIAAAPREIAARRLAVPGGGPHSEEARADRQGGIVRALFAAFAIAMAAGRADMAADLGAGR